MNLIDDSNILSFLITGGKFIYAGENYTNYTTMHIINGIHLPSNVLRSVSNYPSTIKDATALIPVQQISDENIIEIFKRARISINDDICVYSESDNNIIDAFFVIVTLQSWGFKKVSYLNMSYRNLNTQYLTQDYPTWPPVCEKYENNNNNIQVQEFSLLNKLGKITPLDIRSKISFDGLDKKFKINGHVPNAINIFWKKFFIPISITPLVVSNKLIPLNEIEEILNNNGITSETDIVVTCNSGNEITATAFILITLLGWKKVRLFPGSWNVYQYFNQIDPINFPVITLNLSN
jgi:3-mercaptopyruvate sulfurtransferase SseA